MLMLAASSLEAIRFWSVKVPLPFVPGGLLGMEMGRLVTTNLGFTGGTLLLIAVWMAGFSLFVGASWFTIAEKIGTLLEGAVVGGRALWEGWQPDGSGPAPSGWRRC